MTTLLDRPWPAALLLGLASLLLYGINIERASHHDELYHVLAAKGLLETGLPAIGENGQYWRGYPLTWLVAQSFALFGPSLAAARLAPVLFMAGLVALLFLFIRREAGSSAAAWLGAGLFAISPFAIDLAQFVRFYSLQCLLFLAAAWLFYALPDRSFKARRSFAPRRQLPMAAAALLLLAFATYLQPTTLLGVAGVGLWLMGALLLPWLIDDAVSRTTKIHVLLGLVVAGLVALALGWASGLLAELWRDYRSTSLFNRPQANQFWFYHAWHTLFYPTLWTLSGPLAILAIIKWPRLAGFLIVVFAVGFLLNSFAASKNLRYLAYAQPFLFALWGLGLAALLTGAWSLLGQARQRLAASLAPLPARSAQWLAGLLLALSLGFLLVANPAFLRSATLLAGITVPPELPPNDWEAARSVLEPLIAEVETVVTTDELHMLYHYGRADYLLAASKFGELPPERRAPFGRDVRTDVAVINDVQSLELILRCHASGLFVTQSQHWPGGERTRAELAEVAPLLHALAEPLALPPRSRLVAFAWHDLDPPDSNHCAPLLNSIEPRQEVLSSSRPGP
jgi:hypothetical protein